MTVAATGVDLGLEWPGDGAVRQMLYWHNPFPIYDATYIFKVFPRKKIVPTNSPNGYKTAFLEAMTARSSGAAATRIPFTVRIRTRFPLPTDRDNGRFP